MSQLPTELKRRIVEQIVWAPEPRILDETWQDGDLRIELPEHHPLRFDHLPPATGYLKSKNVMSTTVSGCALAALSQTNREMETVTSGFGRQLWSMVTWDEAGAPSLRPARDGTTGGAHVRLLLAEGAFGSLCRDAVAAGAFPSSFRPVVSQCCWVTALSLVGGTFAWLPDILRALPENGRRLEQASFHIYQPLIQPGDLDTALELLSECDRLQVLVLDYHPGDESREVSAGTVHWAYRLLAALCRTLKYAWINAAPSDGDFDPATDVLSRPFSPPGPMSVTRLTFYNAAWSDTTPLKIAENCASTLEVLQLETNYEAPSFASLAAQHPPLTVIPFPRLYHLLFRLSVYVPTAEFDFDFAFDDVVPRHWALPSIRFLEYSALRVDMPMMERLRSLLLGQMAGTLKKFSASFFRVGDVPTRFVRWLREDMYRAGVGGTVEWHWPDDKESESEPESSDEV